MVCVHIHPILLPAAIVQYQSGAYFSKRWQKTYSPPLKSWISWMNPFSCLPAAALIKTPGSVWWTLKDRKEGFSRTPSCQGSRHPWMFFKRSDVSDYFGFIKELGWEYTYILLFDDDMFEMQDGERGSRGSQSDKRGLETLSIVFLTAHDSKIKNIYHSPESRVHD